MIEENQSSFLFPPWLVHTYVPRAWQWSITICKLLQELYLSVYVYLFSLITGRVYIYTDEGSSVGSIIASMRETETETKEE
jgi:hypothetical protein